MLSFTTPEPKTNSFHQISVRHSLRHPVHFLTNTFIICYCIESRSSSHRQWPSPVTWNNLKYSVWKKYFFLGMQYMFIVPFFITAEKACVRMWGGHAESMCLNCCYCIASKRTNIVTKCIHCRNKRESFTNICENPVWETFPRTDSSTSTEQGTLQRYLRHSHKLTEQSQGHGQYKFLHNNKTFNTSRFTIFSRKT